MYKTLIFIDNSWFCAATTVRVMLLSLENTIIMSQREVPCIGVYEWFNNYTGTFPSFEEFLLPLLLGLCDNSKNCLLLELGVQGVHNSKIAFLYW